MRWSWPHSIRFFEKNALKLTAQRSLLWKLCVGDDCAAFVIMKIMCWRWLHSEQHAFLRKLNVGVKEYLSMIKGQHRPSSYKDMTHPTSLRSVCSILQLPDRLTEQAGRGWVSHIFVRWWPVLSLLSLIYCILLIYCIDYSKLNNLFIWKETVFYCKQGP